MINLHKSTEPFEFDDSNWFGYEKPSVLEAFRVLSKEGYYVSISGHDYDMRKKRLEKEYEKSTKAPGPGEEQPEGSVSGKLKCEAKLIGPLRRLNTETLGEQPKEKKGIIYPTTSPKADFYYKHVLDEGNPALKESASQFNDALLDEQAKKIEELTKEKTNLEDKIAILNACKEHNKNVNRKRIKRLSEEIAKLNSIIHDKNAVLSDVAEELRLSKIREKNLAELGLKYVGENEKLKKELADKVVDKIDAQALKSDESSLAWKEKVATYKDMVLAYYEKKIAEKDKVIADLGNELAATKNELEAFKESYKRRIKEDSEHFEHIQKICNAGLQKWLIESEYLEKDKPFRFPQLPEFSEEELIKIQEKVVASCDKAEEGGDQSATIVECGNGITLSKEEAEIIERCTKNGTELHYSEKDGFTYTNVFDKEMPIRCLRGMFHVFTDEEIENMKK